MNEARTDVRVASERATSRSTRPASQSRRRAKRRRRAVLQSELDAYFQQLMQAGTGRYRKRASHWTG